MSLVQRGDPNTGPPELRENGHVCIAARLDFLRNAR
jgi:hypothetical protein